jgi:nucleoside-diphosphate-sugar epimerase
MTEEGNVSKKPLSAANKVAVVLGGCGFIGHHLARRLQTEGYWVRVADIKKQEYCDASTFADDVMYGDLSDYQTCVQALSLGRTDVEVYQLAADMGGASYIFTGEHDANVMTNSVLINLHTLKAMVALGLKRVFYSSSACIYPEHNQLNPDNPNCEESSAYPANPDSEYGWEKLFSERLYLSYMRNYGIEPRIARFHNVYGIEGTWDGGREKAPAAICRKIAMMQDGGEIEIFGDGKQTRSFLYVDECVDGILRLMHSEFSGPVNVGSEEMVSINQLADLVMHIANKKLSIKHIPGPLGVRGRSSDNRLIREKLQWEPISPLEVGMTKTYNWILPQVPK